MENYQGQVGGPRPIINFVEHAHNASLSDIGTHTMPRVLHFSALVILLYCHIALFTHTHTHIHTFTAPSVPQEFESKVLDPFSISVSWEEIDGGYVSLVLTLTLILKHFTLSPSFTFSPSLSHKHTHIYSLYTLSLSPLTGRPVVRYDLSITEAGTTESVMVGLSALQESYTFTDLNQNTTYM